MHSVNWLIINWGHMLRKIIRNWARILNSRSRILPLFTLGSFSFLLQSCVFLIEQPTQSKSSDLVPPPSRIMQVFNLSQYVKHSKCGQATVIYFMVGDDFIDHQVRTIAEKFIETRSPEISQQHEFVFVRKHKFHQESASNELSHNKEILPVLLVIGQTSLNLIDLSKAVNRDKNKVIALDSIKVHKKLHRLLDVYKQIGLTNIHLQLEEMSTSPEQLLLVGLQSTQSDVKRTMNELIRRDSSLKTTKKILVKDEYARRILGIPEWCRGKVCLLCPVNRNLRLSDKDDPFLIQGRRYLAIDPLSEDLSRRFVFPPLQKSKTKEDLMLTVTVDLNKPTHAILPKLYAEFGKEGLLNIPKKMVQEELDGTVKITLTRIPSKLNQIYKPRKTRLSQEEIALLKKSNEWVYELSQNERTLLAQLDADKILSWIATVRETPDAHMHYKLETPAALKYFSKQIVAENYASALLSGSKDKVVEYYSEDCGMCRKYGPIYEQLAQEQFKLFDFYRVNNDKNKFSQMRNFLATPTFVFYKRGHVSVPFIYNDNFHPNRFLDFITTTSEIKLIEDGSFRMHLEAQRKVQTFIQKELSRSHQQTQINKQSL